MMRNAVLSLLSLLVSTVCLATGHDVTAPVLRPSPLLQGSPVVATNGETFVTLWYLSGETYAAVADANGRRLNTADIPVMPTPFAVANSVVYGLTTIGRDYILVWSDASASYLTDLGPDLTLRQTVTLKGLPSFTQVSVASNGSQILVAGTMGSIFPPSQTVAYMVNRDGFLARTPVDLSGALRVSASWSGRDFLIAAVRATGVFMHRITRTSAAQTQISSAAGLFTSPSPYFAAAASNGTDTVVVWSEYVTLPSGSSQTLRLRSAYVADDGSVTAQQIFDLGGVTSVVWNGDSFVATTGNYIMRLDRRGMVIEGPVRLDHAMDKVASLGDTLYYVGESRAIVTVLHTAGSIHGVRSDYVSITPAAQQTEAIASDGTNFMAVFIEQTAASEALTAARMDRSAVATVAEPIAITDASIYAQAAIGHGGSTYLLTWLSEKGTVFAMRLSNQGTVLDTTPIKISDSAYSRPDVAWNGNAFLVAWAGNQGIVGTEIAEDGAGSPVRVLAVNGSMEPRIAWNGKVFLLLYGTPFVCGFDPCNPQRARTYAVRVSVGGLPLDSIPALIDEAPNATSYAASRATVASDGRDFLVALDKPTGAAVVHVNTDGPILFGPPRPLLRWFTFARNDIRWNGHDYVLATQYSAASQYWAAQKQWLSLSHVSPSGDLLDRGIALTDTYATPVAASNSVGESAVLISEPAGDPAVSRVHAYFDSDFQNGPPLPNAPTNVTATGTPQDFTMTWNLGPEAEGAVIETHYGPSLVFEVVDAAVHSRRFNNAAITSVVIHAFNASGMSDGVGAPLRLTPRHRATR